MATGDSQYRKSKIPRSLELMDRMLKQVRPLLGQTGYEAMTMRQVADVTGKSTGTINYHFKNKQGLLLAVLDRELAALSDVDLRRLVGAVEAIEKVSPKNDRFLSLIHI